MTSHPLRQKSPSPVRVDAPSDFGIVETGTRYGYLRQARDIRESNHMIDG